MDLAAQVRNKLMIERWERMRREAKEHPSRRAAEYAMALVYTQLEQGKELAPIQPIFIGKSNG